MVVDYSIIIRGKGLGGQRIRKTTGAVSTFYPFADYEQTGGGVVTKHYSFGGAAVAVRSGSGIFSYLYQDGVNSTVYTSDDGGNITSILEYYAFGGTRFSAGTAPTDRHFTGQREDATGLYYFNSRYYDPQLGQFILKQ